MAIWISMNVEAMMFCLGQLYPCVVCNGSVWCVYNVSDVSLKTHMGGCGGGVCWYSAMVTSPRCPPPGHRQL